MGRHRPGTLSRSIHEICNDYRHDADPDNDCLTSRLASCLAADSRGDIWVGTSENGLNRLSLEADTLTHFYHEAWNPFSLPDNEITSICCGSHGEVWVGTPREPPDTSENWHSSGLMERRPSTRSEEYRTTGNRSCG